MADRPLVDLIERVVKSNLKGTQRDHYDAIIAELESSSSLRAHEHAYLLKNLYALTRDRVEEKTPGSVVVRHPNKEVAARGEYRSRTKLDTAAVMIKLNITTFQWALQQPCRTLAKLGGAYAELAKHGKPDQRPNVTTAQATAIFKRFGLTVS